MSEATLCGRTLYSLAKDEGITETVFSDMEKINTLLSENMAYTKILDSPRLKKNVRLQVIDEDFGNWLNQYTLNFMKILSEKRIVYLFGVCFEAYKKQYDSDRNIKTVTVTTATPLALSLENRLIKKLEAKLGGKIVLKKLIDSEQIGGIIIESEDMMLDLSIKAELKRLNKALCE